MSSLTVLEAGGPRSLGRVGWCPVPSGLQGRLCSLPLSWLLGLLAILGLVCLVTTSLQSLPLVFPQPSSLCASVSNLLCLIRTSVTGFRTSSDPGWSHLEILNFTSARPSFQIRSRAQVLEVRLWTCLFKGGKGYHPSTHYTCQKLKIP